MGDMIVTLDTDEIPSVRALALVKRCAPQRVHFKMREFFLSFEFVRDKQPRQASACTFAHVQHSRCRVPGRIFLPGLSGILLGKFGGRAFFDHRMRTNMNEQRKELTPALLEVSDWQKNVQRIACGLCARLHPELCTGAYP